LGTEYFREISHYAILCQVIETTDVIVDKRKSEKRTSIEYNVLEVLNGVNAMPSLKNLKKVIIDGKADHKKGEKVIILVDDEGIDEEFVVREMKPHGYGIKIPYDEELKADDNLREIIDDLLIMFRKEIVIDCAKLSPRQLRAWAWVDPEGFADAIIREIEAGRFQFTRSADK